jgi:hypothetical protein
MIIGKEINMYQNSLASISCSWDKLGNIYHDIKTNNIKKQDALALSVPIMISSQLGILNIRSAIILCGNCLTYIATLHRTILAIPPILRSVRIELHQKDRTIVEKFYPEIINSTDETKEYEFAILRFYNNYMIDVCGNINNTLVAYLKQSLLVSIYFYLDKVLPKIIELPTFTLDNYSKDVQMNMLNFCERIYPNWGGLLPNDRFMELYEKARKQYMDIRTRLL